MMSASRPQLQVGGGALSVKAGGAVGSQRPDFWVRRSSWPRVLQGGSAHPEPRLRLVLATCFCCCSTRLQ